MHSKCQSCGEDYPNWKIKYQGLDLWECPICNSLSYLTASSMDTSGLYGVEYFTGAEYIDYEGEKKIHELNFTKKWNELKKHLPGSPNVLEVGCAYGYFINLVLQQGAGNAFGIDISKHAIQEAQKKFGLHFGNHNEKPKFNFNCLVSWDVWEHLPTPFETFKEFIKDLEAGGIFAFTTIDASSLVARLRGRRWRQIHPPTHLHYPTRKAMNLSMNKLGLEIIYHGTFGPLRSWKTYLAALGISAGRSDLGMAVDLGDIQFVISRKLTL